MKEDKQRISVWNRRKEIHDYLIDVLKHLQTVIEQQEYDAVIIIYTVWFIVKGNSFHSLGFPPYCGY